MNDLISVRTFVQRFEAEIAQGLLSSEGIDSLISADDCGGQRPDLSMRMGGVQLIVRKEDFDRAEQILEVLEEEEITDDQADIKSLVCEPQYGPSNPSPETQHSRGVMRFGSVIGLKPEKEDYYRELHADVWTTVLDRLRRSSIRNYSIHLIEIEGRKYLVSYLEYVGMDYEEDMKAIAEDPETRRWWKETDPCQFSLDSREPGIKWSPMEMVFLME